MSNDLVTFNIRYERSKFEMKIESPTDVFGFVLKLKSELKIENTDEVVILCPTPEGKMMEIKSDDDIAFLKKTKLSYNSESKEIYCSVELVVTIIHKQLPDDPKVQMMVLSNKIDQLSSQFSQMSQSLDNKIEENTNSLLKNIKSFLQTAETNCLGEQNNINESTFSEFKTKKKPKKNKEKLPSTSYNTSTANNNLPKLNETINQEKMPVFTKNDPKSIDELLDMLAKEGFTNTIQNIIVLKRFDNDYEKAVEYLNKST